MRVEGSQSAAVCYRVNCKIPRGQHRFGLLIRAVFSILKGGLGWELYETMGFPHDGSKREMKLGEDIGSAVLSIP